MEYVLAALALIALTALVIALVGILVALVEFLTGNPYHNRVFDGFLGGRMILIGSVVALVFFMFAAILATLLYGPPR